VLPLQPGDRLMFLTDGVLERRAAAVDIGAVLERGRDHHPREAVQQLIQGAVHASGGRLEDDATAMCFDWHGGPPRERETLDGADVSAE
jgi:serine phosphatase RsbU (regulator of sigma subunit)